MTAREGRFAHKTALITGASAHGIGGAIAHRLAGEGAAVAIASRTEPTHLLDQLRQRRRNFGFFACDVTREADVRAAVAACRERFGPLDVVVNNAGVEHIRRLDEIDESAVAEMLDTNLGGTVRVTRAALPHLTAPGGVIVNVSSVLSLAGCPGFSVYSASKAGLNGFTQSLAWELAPRGVRVVGVAPGVVLTNMVAKYLDHLPPEAAHKFRDSHPLDVGLAGDVAAAVAFLASAEARWITGITLPLGWAPGIALPWEECMAVTSPERQRRAEAPVAGAPGL